MENNSSKLGLVVGVIGFYYLTKISETVFLQR